MYGKKSMLKKTAKRMDDLISALLKTRSKIKVEKEEIAANTENTPDIDNITDQDITIIHRMKNLEDTVSKLSQDIRSLSDRTLDILDELDEVSERYENLVDKFAKYRKEKADQIIDLLDMIDSLTGRIQEDFIKHFDNEMDSRSALDRKQNPHHGFYENEIFDDYPYEDYPYDDYLDKMRDDFSEEYDPFESGELSRDDEDPENEEEAKVLNKLSSMLDKNLNGE
jgi:uncharacterized protein YoxC